VGQQVGVGYPPKSGYDAAMRQVKSWASNGLMHRKQRPFIRSPNQRRSRLFGKQNMKVALKGWA
jgi:hypothetical protein